MRTYTVKQLADAAGVTIRTLHVYDELGLLCPLRRSEAGYRIYGEAELMRLQQILLYKELDIPLQAISGILDDPAFDALHALREHRDALQRRKQRLGTLLRTIDKTIEHLQQQGTMKPHELYEGFTREAADAYRNEAIAAYGNEIVKRAEDHLMKSGSGAVAEMRQRLEKATKALFELRHTDPAAAPVQAAVAGHYAAIRSLWGTTDSSDPQFEAYAGLGRLYAENERFIRREGRHDAHFACFLRDAMAHFARAE